jgi:hypothetical protein
MPPPGAKRPRAAIAVALHARANAAPLDQELVGGSVGNPASIQSRLPPS